MVAAVRLEPACVEVEERDDEDGEEEAAIHAWPVQEVGGRDEEDEIDGRGICAAARERSV